jgi:hypothetical protein
MIIYLTLDAGSDTGSKTNWSNRDDCSRDCCKETDMSRSSCLCSSVRCSFFAFSVAAVAVCIESGVSKVLVGEISEVEPNRTDCWTFAGNASCTWVSAIV